MPSKSTEKRIFLTRHAQAEHNVEQDYSIRDAPLTQLGRQQSRELNEDTQEIQRTAELLVSSGMRRPLTTMVLGYPVLRKRLESEGKPVIILPQLQECNAHPCDRGSPRDILEADAEYAGLDFSSLTEDWTSKEGFYGTDVQTLQARALWIRRWLRERPEQSIVVVCHGDCLRYITDGHNSHKLWGNTEVREYTFASEDDEDALLVPVRKVVQEGADNPTSSSKKFTY